MAVITRPHLHYALAWTKRVIDCNHLLARPGSEPGSSGSAPAAAELPDERRRNLLGGHDDRCLGTCLQTCTCVIQQTAHN